MTEDFSFFEVATGLRTALTGYIDFEKRARGTSGPNEQDENILLSVAYVYLFSIVEYYTITSKWDDRHNDTNFTDWDRFQEFDNGYKVRNCFMHRVGFLDTSESNDQKIIEFTTQNPDMTEFYTIKTHNGKQYIHLDKEWNKKMNKIHSDYINLMKEKGYWEK